MRWSCNGIISLQLPYRTCNPSTTDITRPDPKLLQSAQRSHDTNSTMHERQNETSTFRLLPLGNRVPPLKPLGTTSTNVRTSTNFPAIPPAFLLLSFIGLFLTDRASQTKVEDLGMGVRDDTRRGSAGVFGCCVFSWIRRLWGSFFSFFFFPGVWCLYSLFFGFNFWNSADGGKLSENRGTKSGFVALECQSSVCCVRSEGTHIRFNVRRADSVDR